MAAGNLWAYAETGDSNAEHPDVTYWRERALRAESEARHNRDLAEFTREMGLAVCRGTSVPNEGTE